MTHLDERKADYMVVVIQEFAREQGMSTPDAYRILRDCGGISLLDSEYEIEHTLPLSSTIDALSALSRRVRVGAA